MVSNIPLVHGLIEEADRRAAARLMLRQMLRQKLRVFCALEDRLFQYM